MFEKRKFLRAKLYKNVNRLVGNRESEKVNLNKLEVFIEVIELCNRTRRTG